MRLHAMSVQFLRSYRSCLFDITAAILAYKTTKTAAMLVYRKKSCGDWGHFYYEKLYLFQQICKAAYHVSENDLY